MLRDLIEQYEEMFDEQIELVDFICLPDDQQIEILKRCIKDGQTLYESDYFNDNYIDEVKD